MLITVASLKGGVSKTTTAINLAAYLNAKAPALVLDFDPNQSALAWAAAGRLPFKVAPGRQAAKYAKDHEHFIADTEASLEPKDLKSLSDGCDLLIIPTTPDALALEALLLMSEALKGIGADHYRILLSIIPPLPSRTGEEARATLTRLGLKLFKGGIRRFVAHQKAALEGVTVDRVRDEHAADAWADYVAIGREILQ
jgi:chromosome partitioning protein